MLQDDGFGPHAIARLLEEYELGAEVELLDLGTPGLDFVDYLVGRDVLIIVDALSSGGEPGEIVTFDRRQLKEHLPNMRLSAHQPCLQETLFTAETAGVLPADVLLVGVVGANFNVTTELSEVVEDSMPAALELIAEIVRQHRAPAQKRPVPLPTSSWWAVSQIA